MAYTVSNHCNYWVGLPLWYTEKNVCVICVGFIYKDTEIHALTLCILWGQIIFKFESPSLVCGCVPLHWPGVSSKRLCFLNVAWCIYHQSVGPCNPSKFWTLMHQLPYFSNKTTVACREGCTLCTCACHFCAIFGRVPVFSLHQRLSYGSLLGPFLLRLDHIPQILALVGNVCVFFQPS